MTMNRQASTSRVAERWVEDLDVKYIGAFLDSSGWKRLLKWFKQESGEGLLSVLPSRPHMTIKYGPSAAQVAAAREGAIVPLQVVAWASDKNGQAVEVASPRVESASAIPHITISNAPGYNAVYSNTLLERGKRGDPQVRYRRAAGPRLAAEVRLIRE